jgi:hypothetical protein
VPWSWEQSLKSAIHVGISLSEYNEMTPYELSLYIYDFNEKRKQETEDKIALVRLGEALHRTTRLPTVKQLLEQSKPKKKMTSEEMLKVVKQLNAAFGGEVK